MTERWQKELRKLGSVEPERDAWNRAATRAPGGDGLPPPRQRIVAGIVAFGVFFAAASFGWLALRPTAERTPGGSQASRQAIVTLRGTEARPTATLEVGGDLLQGKPASYSWLGIITDTVAPAFNDDGSVRIEQSAVLAVMGDADSAQARLVRPDHFLSGGDAGVVTIGALRPAQRIDAAPGRYLLEVHATWKTRGGVAFYFPIEIVESAVDGALTTLAGTEWRLTAIDGVPIDEDGDRLGGASIEFKENAFEGWSGCDSFGGKYQVDGSSFSVDGIGGTLVGPCSGEQAWFDRLGAADSWTSDGSTLTVSGPAGAFTATRVGVGTVDTVRVECLPGSTQVLDQQVVATAQGVEGIFGPAGHAKRVEFVPVAASAGNETQVTLGETLTAATVPLTRGDWVVRCAGWGDEFGSAEITVVPDASGSTLDSSTPTASQAASDTLHVSCTDGGALVSTPLVAVQADGVHVVVDEAGGFGELVLDPLDDFPLQFWSGSSGVDGEFARELVPGRWRAGCVVGPQQDRSSVVGWAEFEVIDPHSFWVSTALACGGGEPLDFPANSGPTITKVGDDTPQEAITRELALPASDLVEEAGYEGSFRQAYRIVREGEVVAWLLFSDLAPERWRFTAGWACPGEGFTTEAVE